MKREESWEKLVESAAVAANLLPLEQQRASCLPFFGTLLDLSACSRTLDSHENLVHFFICAPAVSTP